MLPPRPWPVPTPRAASQVPEPTSAALNGPLMPAVVDQIMGNRYGDDPEMPHICKTCGHSWKGHIDGRCKHLFGMEGDFAHICGCSPDEREVLYPLLPGELGQSVGMAAAVAAVATMLAIRR